MASAAQRQFLVSVAGVSGLFATKSGGATTAEVTRVYNGGKLTPELLASPAQTEDLTIGRPWDPDRDAPVLARLRPLVGRHRTTVSVQPTDVDLVAVGRPTVYANALLIGVNDPEADADSGDAARLELTWAVESVA